MSLLPLEFRIEWELGNTHRCRQTDLKVTMPTFLIVLLVSMLIAMLSPFSNLHHTNASLWKLNKQQFCLRKRKTNSITKLPSCTHKKENSKSKHTEAFQSAMMEKKINVRVSIGSCRRRHGRVKKSKGKYRNHRVESKHTSNRVDIYSTNLPSSQF